MNPVVEFQFVQVGDNYFRCGGGSGEMAFQEQEKRPSIYMPRGRYKIIGGKIYRICRSEQGDRRKFPRGASW